MKTYPGEDYVRRERRATFQPDYGGRGVLWVHGAFEPATGQAAIFLSEHRCSASHIRVLEHVLRAFPSERWLLIEDDLSAHPSRDTRAALVAWPQITLQFLPKYAAWLNLIERSWKVLRELALRGRRFATLAELEAALRDALADWNAHRHPYRWRKCPQQQPAPAVHT